MARSSELPPLLPESGNQSGNSGQVSQVSVPSCLLVFAGVSRARNALRTTDRN